MPRVPCRAFMASGVGAVAWIGGVFVALESETWSAWCREQHSFYFFPIWLPLVPCADFEIRPLLTAFVRFFLNIASASNGSKKPALSRLSIALRSREE